MRERLLAVVGAICLVAVAVLVRSAVVGGDDEPGSGRTDGGAPTVACSPTLADLCDALADAGRIAADPPELALGDAAPAELDGWIAWDPGPAVAGFSSPGGEIEAAWPTVEALASAPLAVAGRGEDIQAACGADTWACLAEASQAGTTISVGDAATDEGLARIEPLARALAGGEIDQISGPVTELLRGPVDGQDPAVEAVGDLVARPGSFELVAGPAGLLERAAGSAEGERKGIEVVTPGEPVTVHVVLASRGDLDADDLCGAMADDDDVRGIVEDLGIDADCEGQPMDEGRAGFLYQVKERA